MIVVDASAITNVVLADDPDSHLAALAGTEELHAPALIDFEVANRVRGLLIAGKISERRARAAVDDFAELEIRRYPMTGALRAVIALATNFTAYDAAYLVLAQALQSPLHTADRRLVAARLLGVEVRLVRPGA